MHIGFRIEQAKGLFFDRQKVLSAVSRAERRVLSKFGPFIRQDSKQRIRRRKRSSPPGEAPTNRTVLVKRHIYFVFSPETRSVVIGPVLLNRSTGAPAMLENGGETVIETNQRQMIRVEIEARPLHGTGIPARASHAARPLAGCGHLKGAVISNDHDTSDLPIHGLGMNGNGSVVIRKWFVSFLSLTVSVVFVGAIFRARQSSLDVASIWAEVRAQNELRGAELEDIRRRLARHDASIGCGRDDDRPRVPVRAARRCGLPWHLVPRQCDPPGHGVLLAPQRLRIGPSHVAVLSEFHGRQVRVESTILCPHPCVILARQINGCQAPINQGQTRKRPHVATWGVRVRDSHAATSRPGRT